MRAECHHKYYLYNLTFHGWRNFVTSQRERKSKMQKAESFAEKQRMRAVWDRWEVFTEMRRMKNRMLESALEQNRLSTMRSAWSLWQTRLRRHQNLYTLEEQALKQRERILQSVTWLHWKEMHAAACCQKEKESKAALHFIVVVKRRALNLWITYVSCHQSKKKAQAVAEHASCLRLARGCWSKWRNAVDRKQAAENRLQTVLHLASQSIQRRALVRWRAYVTLCREESERNQIASQHFHHHLLHAGVRGLSLNVTRNRAHRLNNNMAVQHCRQTMTSKYWNLWQDRLEEAEDQSFKPLTEMALTTYSNSLLRSSFYHWREKFAEKRRMQELERRADTWFQERTLPLCFNTWVQFTLQRRLRERRRHKAEVFNRRRQCSWVFYTWWGQSEKHKEEMLSERMAILHEERCHVQRAWAQWRRRTQQQIKDGEKQEASQRLYLHKLLHKAMTQWKDNSTEIRDRRSREQQACYQGDLCCMRRAVEKWKKFVQIQRLKRSRLTQIQRHHEAKVLKHSFMGWKEQHLQTSQIRDQAEELYMQQTQCFLRKVLNDWKKNAAQLAEVRAAEQQAQSHYEFFFQLKVFLAWRDATTRAVSMRHQQREALSKAQRSINQVRLLWCFRRWRKQTREARAERMCMEKARRHHNSKLLSKTVKAWNEHHYQQQKNKVMKRQGILLLKLKMYQKYFEQWKTKLQHRRREAKQTERALWHWSLTLQAKVLCGWRLWVTEQRRKEEQAARAAQVYRDQLLREGVTCILTYAAHMNDLTTCLAQHSQEQRSQHLQRVVKRCAMRWKKRALCKPPREQEAKAPPKKSVTFCLSAPNSSSDSAEQEAEDRVLSKLLQTRTLRRQPRRCRELSEPPIKVWPLEGIQSHCGSTEATPASFTSTCLNTLTSASSPSEPHVSITDSTQEPDLLLPPSAFMTTGTPNMLGKYSGSDPGDAPLLTFQYQPSTYPGFIPAQEIHQRDSSRRTESPHVEDAAAHPASALTEELLSIQLDMKSFQKGKRQLRAWRKLKEVLQTWLQTSGKDENMERNTVCQELEELEERVDRLTAELERRKPTMLLHAQRIQRLQSDLRTSGVYFLSGKADKMETDNCAFTT
ncbi:protein SFI1 homolog isoform X2 [Mugil cephalus]|nr:protein SFI1 homolog isoform X2 [Mugil cephalus]